MIGIEVNGQFLVIDKNSSIRIEKNYPVLFQGLFQGDFTFPFSIDAENNYATLGFANIPSASTKVITFDCYIYLFGMPWQPAILRITKTTRQKFQVNLISGVKTLKTASKLLADLNLGDNTYLGKYPDEIAEKATVISQDFDYTHFGFTFVPHINEGFYGDANPDFKGVLNMVNPNTGDIYYNTTGAGNKYALVPWFYCHFILKKIFEEEGLNIKGSFWTNPEMKKLLVYNNVSLDSLNEIGGSKLTLTTTQNYNQSYFNGFVVSTMYLARTKVPIIKGPSTTYDEPMAFNNSTHEYDVLQEGQYTFTIEADIKINITNIRVGIFVNNKWIGGIDEQSGLSTTLTHNLFSVTYNATIADIGKKAYLGVQRTYLPYTGDPILSTTWTFITINQGATVTVNQSNATNINLFSRYVYPKKHMNNLTVENFLLAIKQLGVEITFNTTDNSVSLDFITDKINDTSTVDWTEKAVPDFETNLDNYNKGYLVRYGFPENDSLTVENFKNIDVLNNIEDFVTFNDLPPISRAGQTAFVKSLNQYFISVYDQYASPQYFWKKFTDHYYSIKYANGEDEINLKFSPMFMGIGKNLEPGSNATLETALMPASKSLGSSEMFGIGNNDFSLQFCFLRGQNVVGGTPNDKGGNYVYAGTTLYGLNGHIVGDFDFSLHLKSGFFQRFINFIYELSANGEETDMDFRLNEVDILKLAEHLKISVDGITYLLKTVSVMAGERLKPSRAKMIKFQ